MLRGVERRGLSAGGPRQQRSPLRHKDRNDESKDDHSGWLEEPSLCFEALIAFQVAPDTVPATGFYGTPKPIRRPAHTYSADVPREHAASQQRAAAPQASETWSCEYQTLSRPRQRCDDIVLLTIGHAETGQYSLVDDVDGAAVRAADDTERARIWAAWVAEFGQQEASRRWLAIFAATDAPTTG